MKIDIKLGSLQVNLEDDKWNKAVVKKEQTNIADQLQGKSEVNNSSPITPFNIGVELMKKLMAHYRKEVCDSDEQALMAEIKGNYKDYLAITKMTPVEQEVVP